MGVEGTDRELVPNCYTEEVARRLSVMHYFAILFGRSPRCVTEIEDTLGKLTDGIFLDFQTDPLRDVAGEVGAHSLCVPANYSTTGRYEYIPETWRFKVEDSSVEP